MFKQIRAAGMKPGVVINPETPLSYIESYLDEIDILTFMTIDPGFAGQDFIPAVLDKIGQARALKEKAPEKYHFIIQIDGQGNASTFERLAKAKVESIIVGTSGLFTVDPDLATGYEKMIATYLECASR